jgi:hypothetical protein
MDNKLLKLTDTSSELDIEYSSNSFDIHLILVVEVTNIYPVWQKTIEEIIHRADYCKGFSTFSVYYLRDGKILDTQPHREIGHPCIYIKDLETIENRKLFLFISDCTSNAWKSGKILSLLKRLSANGLVTLCQLLPEIYWDRSALIQGRIVQLESKHSAEINKNWLIVRKPRHYDPGFNLPVIRPSQLEEYAESITTTETRQFLGYLFQLDAFNPSVEVDPPAQEEPLTAKQLVQRFRSTASGTAQLFAERMADISLSWNEIFLLQDKVNQEIPTSKEPICDIHLAEIFLSGIVKTKGSIDFKEGVRNFLLWELADR